MSMRELLRRMALIARMSIRTDPLRSLGALAEPLGGVFQMLLGLWVKLLVDGVMRHDEARAVTGAVCIAASMLLYFGTGLLGNLARVALAERVGFAFDRQIAEMTARIPSLEPFERADYADELQILRQNRALLGGSLNSLLYTFTTALRALTAVVMLTAVDPRLLLLLAAAVPAVIGARLRYRWDKAAEDASASHGRLARHLIGLATTVSGAAELRTYRLESEVRARLRAANTAWRRPVVAAERKKSVTTALVNATFAAALTGVIGWLLVGVAHHNGSPGTIAMAVVVAGDLQQVVVGTVNRMGDLANVLRSAGRFLWLRDRAAEIAADFTGTVPPPETLEHGITFENVTFRYPGASRDSLRNVSLHIPAGSILALVGENGAGKSTMVGLLAGLHRPTSGRILIDGIDLRELDILDWRAAMSAAFQDFAKLEFSAQHAVGVGHLPHVDTPGAVHTALLEAQAADVETALPQGLATQLGSTWEDGVDLSGGQWQKLALGRAMMRRSPLLLVFDEPTASLDAPTEHALFSQYAATARTAAAQGAITILVTHRFSTVRAADHIAVLADGALTEYGSHEELIDATGEYAQLYEMQARGYR